jgi:hypothetical protein
MSTKTGKDCYKNHPYTRYKTCPCKIDQEIIKKTQAIFEKSESIEDFVEKLEKSRIKGKKIWFDKKQNMIFISKPHACESGGGCPENDSLIGNACHCPRYNHLKEHLPKNYCQCGAEYYRPMFEPIFGKKIKLIPYKTVLSGDDECVIGVKLHELSYNSDITPHKQEQPTPSDDMFNNAQLYLSTKTIDLSSHVF